MREREAERRERGVRVRLYVCGVKEEWGENFYG